MELDNKKLYESDEVVAKYSSNSTRLRSLNNAEKNFIDKFDIKNKKVLVIGSGAGRVPVNLLLFGNVVVGVDRSKKLVEFARSTFPNEKFKDLTFVEADAENMDSVPDESFDVVYFAMNTIDYIDSIEHRQRVLIEAKKKIKIGGILAFSSHNSKAYFLSPKVRIKDKHFKYLFVKYVFAQESVVGGGTIFKGDPDYIIEQTFKLGGLKYQGFVCDSRSNIDRFISRKLLFSKFYFPYIVYVFIKE